MGLSSVFQVLQLAVGPSLSHTHGALKVGQYFREVLIGVPYHPNNRIIIEFLGNFAKFGKENNSNMAVIAGLGGFVPGTTRMGINRFHQGLTKDGSIQLLSNTWPFTEESDLIYNHKKLENHTNKIRFHVVSDEEKVLLQAEYSVSGKGIVSGPGSRDSDFGSNLDQIDSFEQILQICESQHLSLLDYIYSSEEMIHSITKGKAQERMMHTWSIMEASMDNGINNSGSINSGQDRRSKIVFDRYKDIVSEQDLLSREYVLASIFAASVCEESLSNQLVITSPVCETAGIVAGVLKSVKTKFHFSNQDIADALLVAGFIGSLLQKFSNTPGDKNPRRHDFKIATAMATSACLYLINRSNAIIYQGILNALSMADSFTDWKTEDLIWLNTKHANLSLTCVNLTLIGLSSSGKRLEQYFRK